VVEELHSPTHKISAARGLAILAVFLIAAGYRVEAQEPSGWIEFLYNQTDLQTVNADGQPVALESSAFRQRYNLELNWRLYPQLSFVVGGLFEKDDAVSQNNDLQADITRKRWRPYISLRQRSRLFSGSLDVIRIEDTSRSGTFSSGRVLDTYSVDLGWRPDRYPLVSFRIQRRDNYDPSREIIDTLDDLVELRTEYMAWERLRVFYRGSIREQENRVDGNGVLRRAHTGELAYADSLWRQRIQLSAEYNVNHQKQELTTSGVGEIANPVDPLDGLSINSDTPLNVTLDPNPALIDEDLSSSAGINLGVPPPIGDERPRNIGLDLGIPAEVNAFRLWVDQDLPLAIANTFVWEVYTSEDNLNWVLRQTVAPASFDLLEPTFEIRFSNVTARYVKVVTLPLQRNVPGSEQFPNIIVTELQAFLRIPAADATTRSDQTTQRFTSDLRVRLLERHNFFYEFSYSARGTQSLTDVWNLYNGLSFSEALNPTLRLSARVGREDNAQLDEELSTWLYSASLRAVVVPTLQQTLVFSGRVNEFEVGSDYINSVFLNNTLAIYRGVKANIGLGTTAGKRPDGERIGTQQVNARASLVPHRTLTFNLQYLLEREDRRGSSLGPDSKRDRTFSRITVAYIPVSAIYLFAGYRVERKTDSPERTFQNYSASWSPFAGGALQLTLAYNETLRSDLDTTFRIYTTRARWNISRRWWVQVAWQKSSTDSLFVQEESDILRASTRFVF